MLSNMSLSFSKSKWVVKKKEFTTGFSWTCQLKWQTMKKSCATPGPDVELLQRRKNTNMKTSVGCLLTQGKRLRASGEEGGDGLRGGGVGGSGMKAKLYLQKQKGY